MERTTGVLPTTTYVLFRATSDITYRHGTEKGHLHGHPQREDMLAMYEAHSGVCSNISREQRTALPMTNVETRAQESP